MAKAKNRAMSLGEAMSNCRKAWELGRDAMLWQ
jgi:hypothetical protein